MYPTFRACFVYCLSLSLGHLRMRCGEDVGVVTYSNSNSSRRSSSSSSSGWVATLRSLAPGQPARRDPRIMHGMAISENGKRIVIYWTCIHTRRFALCDLRTVTSRPPSRHPGHLASREGLVGLVVTRGIGFCGRLLIFDGRGEGEWNKVGR